MEDDGEQKKIFPSSSARLRLRIGTVAAGSRPATATPPRPAGTRM
jgi:hypothetical protein